jgi:hypothetical protein
MAALNPGQMAAFDAKFTFADGYLPKVSAKHAKNVNKRWGREKKNDVVRFSSCGAW